MVVGKLPVSGRPTNLDYSRARAYCAALAVDAGGGVWTFFSLNYHFSFLSLWETARYRLKYCLKGPLSQKQPTNQPTIWRTKSSQILILHEILFAFLNKIAL